MQPLVISSDSTAPHITRIVVGSFPFGLAAPFRDSFFPFSVVSAKCLQRRAGASCVSVWMKTFCRAHCVYCQKHFGVIGPIQCLWNWNLDGIRSNSFFFLWLPSSKCILDTKDVVTEETHFFEKYLSLAVKKPGLINSCMDVQKVNCFLFSSHRLTLTFLYTRVNYSVKQMQIPFMVWFISEVM